MSDLDYKEHLERYQNEVRTKLTDIQQRMVKLNSDISDLSLYVQSGIFYNCIKGMENKEQTND